MTKFLFLVVAVVLPCILAASSFDEYVQKYNKKYDAQEYSMRQGLYNAKVAEVDAHNAQGHSWRKAVDHMADWTPEEYQKLMGFKTHMHHARTQAVFLEQSVTIHARTSTNSSRRIHHKTKKSECEIPLITGLAGKNEVVAVSDPSDYPDSVDWTKHMNPVVPDQAACGSCWALAGVATAEGVLNIATGTTDNPSLSAQQFVDCTANPNDCGGTGGCGGATIDLMLEEAIERGIASLDDYAYKGSDEECQSASPSATVEPCTHHQIATNSYSGLMDAIQLGPVAVSVAANNFNSYSGGILSSCDSIVNHAVVLVGYGPEEKGSEEPYWILRNSWGSAWGEDGYLRIKRNVDSDTHCEVNNKPGEGVGCKGGPESVIVCGECGILYAASYLDAGAVSLA